VSENENRQHERYPCDRDLDGQLPQTPESSPTFRCHAVNASEGGMMLEVSNRLEVGQRMELFLTARDSSRSFVAEAEVRWCEAYGEHFRCGVMFLSRRENYVF